MGLKIDLTKDKPDPLRFEITEENGDLTILRVTFKRRLNRQQAQEVLYTKGRGQKAQTRIDYRKLYKMTIESLGPFEELKTADGNGVGEDGVVTDSDLIADILISGQLHADAVEAIDEYAIGQNRIGDVEKNS